MKAIEITDLAKLYRGKKRARVQALKDLSLALEPGEVFGFLGPNGAGKSTTIKILTGQIRPTSGNARLFGVPVGRPESRLRVGYLPENPAFYDFMTGREYLRFVGQAYGLSAPEVTGGAARVLGLLELEKAADRKLRSYSKGMVQRLGLAQALLPDPDLLILDEPMSGLDPLGRALVKDLIKEQKKAGKTVFFSTHITADVEIVCDRVGILAGGQLRALDRVETILAEGVEGYRLHLAKPGEEVSEIEVTPEELKSTLERTLRDGGRIERVEPQRRDLERYFLEVVKEAGNDPA